MLSNQSNQTFKNRTKRLASVGAALGMAVVLAGCSADVSRFDLGKYSYANSDGPTGSLPTPSEPMAADRSPEGRLGESYPRGQAANRPTYNSYERKYSSTRDEIAARRERAVSSDVSSSRLSDLSTPSLQPSLQPDLQPRQQKRLIASLPKQSPVPSDRMQRRAAGAQSIIVERGDTLYGLSRRHGITVAALMSANGLRSKIIRPGQSLALPGASVDSGQAAARPAPADNTYRTASAPSDAMIDNPGTARDVTSDDARRYTIRSGDSLYKIARQYGMSTAQLVAANPDVNPRRLRPGQELNIPSVGTVAAGRNDLGDQNAGQAPRVVNQARYSAEAAPKRMASLRGDTLNDAAPGIRKISRPRKAATTQNQKRMASLSPAPKLSSARRFRWPVKGKVISKFGLRNDGTHNDGINLSVPMGTSVQAAENGVVAYAGDELKGYGNLILLRHADNWVTAYAHNSNIMVKRGDKIRRGQVIARAGKTGTVDQPQLHFELRKGSKPVNPLPYMQ